MLLALMLLVSGCSGVSQANSAVDLANVTCEVLEPLVEDHSNGLLKDGGPISLQTGVRLIASYDGACE